MLALCEADLRAKLPKITDPAELDGILIHHAGNPGLTPAVRNLIELRRAELAPRPK